MILLFFFFIVLFFFPYLLIPFFVFFGLLILLVPFKFTIDSFFNLFFIPKQIYQIATNPALRRNHALEHATVNILEREYGYRDMAGYAEENGFYIMGADNFLYVEEAARKGLSLMKAGHHELAIHKRCGTSLTVVNFLSAIIFLLLLFYTGNFSFSNMIIAIIVANLMGPYLGQIVQKYFTTSPDVKEMEIISVNYANNNFWNRPVKLFVQTTRIPYVK